MASFIIKKGYASVKEDGLRSFLWSKRWLVLREQTLTIQRNEVKIKLNKYKYYLYRINTF